MFEIFTDSGANLPERLIKKYNIHVVSFTCSADGEEFPCRTPGKEFDFPGFYAALRSKRMIKTSMINEYRFREAFEPYARRGAQILYVGFSSALSGTFAAAEAALGELHSEYDFAFEAVDTLSGSLGEGLLCYYAALMKGRGADLSRTAARIRSLVPHLRSRFSCDDLFYIKRGGRISAATALAGSVLGIKPMLKAAEDGKIVMYDKVRGRRAALDRLAAELVSSVDRAKKQIVAISHADCREDADYLSAKLRREAFISDVLSEPMEPVTASHGGPGMIALFYIADKK